MKIIHSLHKKKKRKIVSFLSIFILVLFIIVLVFSSISFYFYQGFINHSNLNKEKNIKMEFVNSVRYESNNKIEEKPEKNIKKDDTPKISKYKNYENKLINSISLGFVKPFNYIEKSYCLIKINILTKEYKIYECNADAIFKRNVEISLINSLKNFNMPVIDKNSQDKYMEIVFKTAE